MTLYNKKAAIHECGHALLAKLFDECFEIKNITLDTSLYSKQANTDDWQGAILLGRRPFFLQNQSIENLDKLIITMWGGLAAQNIYIKGQEDIKRNLLTYLNSPNLLDSEGFDGDWNLTEQCISGLIQIRGISYDEYRVSFLGFAFDYLMLDKVWETTNSLAELVLSKANVTITQSEIEQHFIDTGFLKFLCKNKTKILSKRYKVTLNEKINSFFKCLLN